MQSDSYAAIVEMYDPEHADFTEDIELMLELAQLGNGPILELGCGTGRIVMPLAKAGHRVIGVDSSMAMLKIAEERKAASATLDITLRHGDMTYPSELPDTPFGLILATLNSIMHLDAESQRDLINSAYQALKPGGRLVIDALNPSLGQLNYLMNAVHWEGSWTQSDGSTVDKWGQRKLSHKPQVFDTLIWYDLVQTDGNCRRARTRFEFRYVHQSELSLLLELAGFAHVDWYGSYELDPWDAESDRIIAVAHKDNV